MIGLTPRNQWNWRSYFKIFSQFIPLISRTFRAVRPCSLRFCFQETPAEPESEKTKAAEEVSEDDVVVEKNTEYQSEEGAEDAPPPEAVATDDLDEPMDSEDVDNPEPVLSEVQNTIVSLITWSPLMLWVCVNYIHNDDD